LTAHKRRACYNLIKERQGKRDLSFLEIKERKRNFLKILDIKKKKFKILKIS